MRWSDPFILATYAAQLIQVCFFPVPSAGSTLEMLFKVRKDHHLSVHHPAKGISRSVPKMMAMAAATLAATLATLIPLTTILFPPAVAYLLPFTNDVPAFLMILSILLIIGGNVLTFVAVKTLRSHVTFHQFGETTKLHTAGIYGYIRNPITVGLAAIFLGFFVAIPSAVMLIGLVVFGLNSAYRVTMEEVYLERAFGEEYARYKKRVGKYFPKFM